jgi:hypothetical protein
VYRRLGAPEEEAVRLEQSEDLVFMSNRDRLRGMLRGKDPRRVLTESTRRRRNSDVATRIINESSRDESSGTLGREHHVHFSIVVLGRSTFRCSTTALDVLDGSEEV